MCTGTCVEIRGQLLEISPLLLPLLTVFFLKFNPHDPKISNSKKQYKGKKLNLGVLKTEFCPVITHL